MSPEEKIAAETAQAEAEAKTKADKEKADADFEESIANLSDVEKEAKRTDRNKHTDNEIDYKAEAEKERKARIEAEQLIIQNKIGKKKKKEEENQDDDDGDDDDDRPVTHREMREIVSQTEKKTLLSTAKTIALSIATSEAEADLIVAKWENRTFPPNLPLSDQIEEMYGAIHSKRIIGQKNEALRSLKNKDNVNNDGSGSHRDPPGGTEPKIEADMKLVISQSKLVFNATSKRYERKLPNGDTIYYDPKSKSIKRTAK